MCRHTFLNARGQTFAVGYDYRLSEWYWQRYSRGGQPTQEQQPTTDAEIEAVARQMGVIGLFPLFLQIALALNTGCCPDDQHRSTRHYKTRKE